MKEAGSIELFHYWNRLRKGRAAPKRSDVEPADIRKLLSDTFILEQDGRDGASFRLAGTRLCSIYGRELKGASFPDLWRPRDRRLVTRMVRNALNAGRVVVMNYAGRSEKSHHCSFELLLLPLDGGENHPRCLGIVSASKPAFWLGSEAVVENSLESVRLIDADREPLFLANRPAITVPPLAPQPADLALPEADAVQGRRVGHLLVFEGGRGGVGRN